MHSPSGDGPGSSGSEGVGSVAAMWILKETNVGGSKAGGVGPAGRQGYIMQCVIPPPYYKPDAWGPASQPLSRNHCSQPL